MREGCNSVAQYPYLLDAEFLVAVPVFFLLSEKFLPRDRAQTLYFESLLHTRTRPRALTVARSPIHNRAPFAQVEHGSFILDQLGAGLDVTQVHTSVGFFSPCIYHMTHVPCVIFQESAGAVMLANNFTKGLRRRSEEHRAKARAAADRQAQKTNKVSCYAEL